MAALAAAKNVLSRKEIGLTRYPVNAGSVIHKGAIVCIDADGYLVPAADTAGLVVVGIADESVTGGSADGDEWCYVMNDRDFLLGGSGLGQTDVGGNVTVVDDATVGLAGATTNDIIVGKLVEFVSATQGWVRIHF